ncbi:MAG: hypothetical protein LWX07_12980 [Bacteroidetes bacterium]|nr:hypothetical protein [Bacteroidota bacterium]
MIRKSMFFYRENYWEGQSESVYKYEICKLPYSFFDETMGNYIYCKYVEEKWIPIFIGQGDLSLLISNDNPCIKCIKDKGATHVHIHLNSDEKARKEEESDLLAKHTEVYTPIGCNGKEGG